MTYRLTVLPKDDKEETDRLRVRLLSTAPRKINSWGKIHDGLYSVTDFTYDLDRDKYFITWTHWVYDKPEVEALADISGIDDIDFYITWHNYLTPEENVAVLNPESREDKDALKQRHDVARKVVEDHIRDNKEELLAARRRLVAVSGPADLASK